MSNLGCAFPRSYFCSVRVEITQAFRSLFLGKSRQSPLSPKGALFLDVSFFFDIFA